MQQGIDITPRSISGRIVGELEILDLSANTMLCLAAIYQGDSNIYLLLCTQFGHYHMKDIAIPILY